MAYSTKKPILHFDFDQEKYKIELLKYLWIKNSITFYLLVHGAGDF